MQRRQFVKMLAAGSVAVAGSGFLKSALSADKPVASPAKKDSTSLQKQWARERYKGIENLLFPSFTPDFKQLDEEGIRQDVRNSIRHGFFSSMLIAVGLNFEEYKQFIKVACDEAKGKMLTGVIVAERKPEEDFELLAYTQKVGCSHVLVTPDRNFRAKTEDELYQAYVERLNTTNLPVVLYAPVAPYYRQFGPSGVPLRVFDRLANLPNVVAVKTSQPVNLATVYQVCDLLTDRLLIGPVNLDCVPLLAQHYRCQWSGQWNVEAVQSPEKPYAVEMMKLFNAGKKQEALKVYEQLEPALSAFFNLQAPYILKGVHPWSHNKYFTWCTGGNGGLVRKLHNKPDYVPALDQAGRDLIKATYKKIGITPTQAPDEEFIVGKTAYAKGVRAKDMTEKPYYS